MPLRVSVKTAINFPLGNDNDLFKLKLQNLVLIKNFHSINNMYKYYMPLRVSVNTAINFPLGKYDLLKLNCKISRNHPVKYII